MKKQTWICTRCGSEDVTCEATVKWDVKEQEWKITSVDDVGSDWCNTCEDETETKQVDINQVTQGD